VRGPKCLKHFDPKIETHREGRSSRKIVKRRSGEIRKERELAPH